MEDQTAMQFLPERLVTGYRAFLGRRFQDERQRFKHLAEQGQNPSIMLIGCCDSRVAPEVIFDAGPGEIFVVRNVANLVPPYKPDDDLHGTSAALEFAVMGLRVAHIVVLGHASCGGIKSYVQGEEDPYQRPLSPGDFIGKWMSLIQPAAQHLGVPQTKEGLGQYVDRLGQASVIQSLANLRTFPCVRLLEIKNRLQLHGAFFGIEDGILSALNEETGEFLPLAEGQQKRSLFHAD